MERVYSAIASTERWAVNFTRLALVIVTVWIGGLKIYKYEDRGIIPFVANSPFMRWMINDPDNYKKGKMPEGAVNAAAEAWHEANGTYLAAWVIGGIIVTIGILIALGWIFPEVGLLGSLALFGMSFVTLSFLVTTPEVWVPNLGSGEYGFPLLAGPGRLVLKDVIMMGASWWSAVEFAKALRIKSAAKKAGVHAS